VLFALAEWSLFPSDSIFGGFSYLPPSWLGALALPSVLGCWLARSKWTSAVALAAYLLLVCPHADLGFGKRTEHRSEATASPKLSVVALNVQYYAFGIETVTRALKQINADVALLSENVLDEAGIELARRELAPLTLRVGRSGETAIVSRFPVLEFKEVELPTFQASLWGTNRLEEANRGVHRSFVHAVLDVDATPVHVISVRLIAGRAPEGDLRAQIDWGLYLMRSQLAEVGFLKSYLRQLKGPFIFGGDLNAPPSAQVIRSLNEVARDAYLATNRFGRPTFRVRVPLLRLDYLFASKEWVPLAARRVDIEVSDHFPVYAEFQLGLGDRRAAAVKPERP
jgi:endonuclease/exonuclease/phosphatase (EEP) superfamily protein YafD